MKALIKKDGAEVSKKKAPEKDSESEKVHILCAIPSYETYQN